MNPLFDILLFVFVAALTVVMFLTQGGIAAYSAVGVIWFLYIMSYTDDDSRSS